MPPDNAFESMIAPDVLATISGKELLIQHLGYWPTFHDFEVVSICLDRAVGAVVSAANSDLRAVFLVFDTNEAPESGERKQGTTEILFEDVDELHIDGFNYQNPIIGLSIVTGGERGRLRVKWGGTCMRHEVSFVCSRISVLRVVDLNPFRKASP